MSSSSGIALTYQPSHRLERLLPDGAAQIVIALRHERFPVYSRDDYRRMGCVSPAIVSGPCSQYVVIRTAELMGTVGVHFRPGRAAPALGLPACELANQGVDLDAIWGALAGELREQLLAASGPDETFRILEQALLQRVRWERWRNPAILAAADELLHEARVTGVGSVTERSGMSQRRFIELFKEIVGMTPKRFSRVRRFREAVRQAGNGRAVAWSELAQSCGYFDQAHFAHDFREFAGIRPTAYLLGERTCDTHAKV